MRQPLLSVLLLAFLAAVLSACGGGSTTTPSPAQQPPVSAVEQALPALASLDDAAAYKHAMEFNYVEEFDLPLTSGNYTSNAIVDAASLQLPSGGNAMSAAWFGVTVQYVKDNTDPENPVLSRVPYVAPYNMTITKTGGSYWFLLADYASGKWNILPQQISDNTHTFDVGLVANAANAAGSFWFAIVAYDGENVNITDILMDYPKQTVVGGPIDCYEWIEASDGTRLATSVFLPMAEESPIIPDPPYPAVMFRTPYFKDPLFFGGLASTLGQINVVTMVQYFRGRLNDTGDWPDSDGEETLFREHAGPEHTDAVDTIEWLKQRQFYNGDLLLAGPSALGIWQYQAATAVGDDIAGFYPIMSSADVFSWAAQRGGCFKRSNVEGWLSGNDFPAALIEEAETKYAENDTAYFDAVDFKQQASGVNAPGWHETGWFDVDVESTIASWRAFQDNGGPNAAGSQYLLIGPWKHDFSGLRPNIVGDLEFPDDGSINDPSALPAQWDALDASGWGMAQIGRNPFYTPPANPVRVYFIGAEGNTTPPHNRWYELTDWPPTPEGISTMYLTDSNTLEGSEPADGQVAVQIDPSNPVPTVGGANLEVVFNSNPVVAGPLNQNSIGSHPGVEQFSQSGIVTETTVAGPIRAVLYVSVTGVQDADLMVKLVDVYPGGTQQIIVADSCVRLSRYLAENGMGPVAESTIYEIEIEIGQRAWVFANDHTIRLDIATSNYPRFAINPADGTAFYDPGNPSGVTGALAMHTGSSNPSRLILPVYTPST